MNEPIRILTVEDLKTDFELAQREIRKSVPDCVFQQVETREGFLQALEKFQPDLILSDYSLPRFDGMTALKLAQERAPLTPFIIWTGSQSEDVAVECMRAGANNYILKENIKRLGPAVLHALQEGRLLREREAQLKIAQGLSSANDLPDFMRLIHHAIAKVIHAENFFAVFFNPETGLFEEIYSVDQYDPPAAPSKLEKSITSYVFRTGQPVLMDQSLFDQLSLRGEVELVGTNSAAWLGVPLKTPNGTLGVIVVQDYEDPIRYSERDRDFLASIGSQAALVIERKQAEEKLRAQDKRFHSLIENGLDNISLLAADGTLLWENPSVNRTLGYAQDEFVNRNIFELMHPDDLGWTSDLFAQLTREPGRQERGEFRLRHQDGTWRWIEATATNMLAEPTVNAIVINYRDVTERKQAEQDLRQSEERYRGLFENLVIGFALHEIVTNEAGEPVDYIFLEINPMFEKLTGIRAREAIGRRVTEVLPGVENDRFIQIYGRVALTGEPVHLEDFTTALGQYYEINAYSPKHGQFAVTFTDITERRQAELQLRKLSRAVEQSASTIVITDAAGNIEYVNPKFTQITGYALEEVAGRNPRLLKSGYTPPEEYRRLWAAISAGGEWRGELYNRKKNGDFFWEQATISPIMNERGETTHYIAVKEDVTERKRTETLMEKRFELMEYAAGHSLQELVQKALDEISAWTHSTIGFFQFIEADQVTPSLQVWSTDTFRQFHSSEGEAMHLPADQAGVWAEAMRQRRAVIHNDYESLPRKKGLPEGHAPLIRELVLPIIRNEKIVAVIGIGNKPQDYTRDDLEITERFADYAWDITERKQMELALAEERNQLARRVDERTGELIRANSNLARALRVKDEFLANMSHELRTPLNAILGLSESLAEQIAGPLNEKQLKYITTISESGHHLLSLINDILDLAKIEAGQITLDINKVDVNSVCQASLRMIKQLAQKKNQEVLLEIEAGVGLMWADERRLKQMMVNLLSNAVKFTPEGGKLGLEIRGDQEANKVMITVWDNGIGIHESDLDRLFKPFVQLDSGLARESSGTGLGLVLVAQMARLHGGSVHVTSEPGQGSRFTIELPWEPALALDAAERLKITGKFHGIRPGTKRHTLLLVEDTPDVVMMLKDYLEMQGYNVVTAQDGLDGVAQARRTQPDLILMDVQMPRMDGLEATQKLRQDPEFKYTPIIALTALAMPSDRERCLASGMDEYISKPVNLRALSKIIQGCLSAREEKTRPR